MTWDAIIGSETLDYCHHVLTLGRPASYYLLFSGSIHIQSHLLRLPQKKQLARRAVSLLPLKSITLKHGYVGKNTDSISQRMQSCNVAESPSPMALGPRPLSRPVRKASAGI